MSQTSRTTGNIAVVVATVLLVGLGLGGYYYQRATSNSDLLTQRNLRTLGRMSDYLEARINNFESILSHFACVDSETFDERTRQLLRQLDVELMDEPEKRPPFLHKPTLEVDLGRARLRLHYAAACSHLTPSRGLQATADLRALAAPILQSADFDAIGLADTDGWVIYQDERSALTVDKLPDLAAASGGAVVSSVTEVTLGGRRYKLFLQPVRLALPPSEDALGREPTTRDTTTWVVAGAVSAARFRSESLAFDPNEIVVCTVLLIGAVLAWPFLKLWCMGPLERIEVRDVLFMGFSYIVASGLAGLFLADLVYYLGLKSEVDTTLRGIGTQLEENLQWELGEALDELEARSGTLNEGWCASAAEDDLRYKTGIRPLSYDYLKMLVWVDGQGQQVAKWTVSDFNTPSINVASRAYFKNARDGRLWRREARDYFVESILSLNTGEHLAAISMPHPEPADCEDAPAVAVLITRLVSIDQPVLPPGFGFAILEGGGRTLFHHQSHRNLLESFLEETAPRRPLASLLRSRRAHTIDAVYQGRDSRLFVTPVASTPLAAVAYFDKTYLRTVNAESVLAGGALVTVNGFVLLVLFAIFTYSVAPRRLRWAWPHRDRPDKYVRLNAVLGLFAASLAVQVVFFAPHLSLFLVPFQALGLGVVVATAVFDTWDKRRIWGWIATATAGGAAVLCHGRLAADGAEAIALPLLQALVLAAAAILTRRFELGELAKRAAAESCDCKSSVSRPYLTAVLLVLFLVGLAPGLAAFRLGSGGQFEHLVRYSQLEIAEDLLERDERLRALERDLLIQPFLGTCYQLGDAESSCPEDLSEASPALAGDTHGDRIHAYLQSALGDYLPFLTAVSTELRGFFEPPADTAWSWEHRDGKLLRLDWRPGVEPGLRVFSRLPEPPTVLCLLGVAGVGLALLLFGVLARWQNRRIFLLDLDPADHLLLRDVLPSKILRSLLIVCTRATSREPFQTNPDFQYVDLIACAARGHLPRAIHPNKIVCLDYFDHRLAEPAWNALLLDFLEDLVYSQRRRVVLLTSREPDTLLRISGHDGETPEEKRARAILERRWMRLVGQFVKLTAADGVVAGGEEPDPPEPAPAATLQERIVRSECGETRRLREIGCQVMARPDFATLDREALLDQIREMAENYYRALWTILSEEEKLLLAQLARGAVVHPECRKPLRRLLARGLLHRDPELRIFNESFGRYLRETVSDDQIAAWERAGARSAWQLLKVPLFLTLVTVAVFLFATQRELFNSAMALISALTVGVPAFFKLLSMVGQSTGKKVISLAD